MPTGTVTFLFTDIEGSTRLWELYPRAMQAALARHDTLLREAIEAHGGYVFKTVGDAFCAAFSTAPQGLEAALAVQRALHSTDWTSTGITEPLQVRMGLHTGAAEERDGDYFGPPLNRAARLMSAGYGGQILLSLATQQLVRDQVPPDVDLRDLGEGGLKDLVRSEHVYQVVAPDLPADFPPLKSLDTRYIEPVAGDGGVDVATGKRAGPLRQVKNPYKGLRAFHEKDASDFFGREALTERLLTRVAEAGELTRFLAVVGPSGSGKSSVVRAGLVPALKQGKVPGSERWLVIEMLPSAHPFEELDAVLLSINANPNPPATLLELLQSDTGGQGRGLVRAVKRVLPRDETVELVLVIDQFEELFTLVEDEGERGRFLESLYAAVTDLRSRVRIIVTLRADFYDRPLLYPNPGELVRQRTEVVLPLSAEELERSIVRPAQRMGVTLEAELLAAIIKDVGEQPGALPLLQYALTELFERRVGKQLTLDAYRESGGVLGALSRRADEIYAGLSGAEKEVARQLFLRLVTPGEGVEDTRRRVRTPELYSITGSGHIADSTSKAAGTANANDKGELDRVMEAFGRNWLLTFDRDPITHGPTVEVAHEALIRTWGRLREWLDASRANLRLHRQLMAASGEWAAGGRDRSFLAIGARLAQFEALAADIYSPRGVALNEEERTYLEASLGEKVRQEETERERQSHELELARQSARAQRTAANRLRYLVAGLAVFFIIASLLALWALSQSQAAQLNATEANSQRQLAQQSAATAQADFQRSEALRLASEGEHLAQAGGETSLVALLSIRSLKAHYTPQSDALLLKASTLNYPLQVFTDSSSTGALTAVAFSPDGKYVLTVGVEGIARLWDPGTDKQIRQFTGYTDALLAVAFSGDGKYILTGANNGIARLWDAQTGKEVHPFNTGKSAVTSVSFSQDDKYVLTSGSLFSGSVGVSGTVQIWDTQSGKELRTFTGHSAVVASAVFSHDGKYVLAGGGNRTIGDVVLWDTQSGKELRTFLGHTGTVWSVAFSPDDKYILSGSNDTSARIWDTTTGQELRHLTGHTSDVSSVAYSPDGRHILTGGADRTARIWDANTGQELRHFEADSTVVESVAYSPDGKYLLTGGDDKTARLWDTSPSIGLQRFNVTSGQVNDMRLSPDGKYLFTASADKTVQMWDIATGLDVRHFTGHTAVINSLAISPDGRYLVTASADKTARVWDTSTGKQLFSFIDHFEVVNSVKFSPDGKYVLSGDDSGVVLLWELRTGKESLRLTTGGTVGDELAFSSSGKFAVTTGSDVASGVWGAQLWELATGHLVRFFKGEAGVPYALAFSPDGQYILTGSAGRTARLLSTQTGEAVQHFVGHTDSIWRVGFSPDGEQALTQSSDNTVREWNIQTGQELRRFDGAAIGAKWVTFSSDGRYLLAASASNVVSMWPMAYQDTVNALCAHLLRDFTEDERAQYGIIDKAPTCPK